MSHSCVCAVQTYWLLLAVSQDQPKNKYVAELRDCCERAALEGSWVCCPPEHMTQSKLQSSAEEQQLMQRQKHAGCVGPEIQCYSL